MTVTQCILFNTTAAVEYKVSDQFTSTVWIQCDPDSGAKMRLWKLKMGCTEKISPSCWESYTRYYSIWDDLLRNPKEQFRSNLLRKIYYGKWPLFRSWRFEIKRYVWRRCWHFFKSDILLLYLFWILFALYLFFRNLKNKKQLQMLGKTHNQNSAALWTLPL